MTAIGGPSWRHGRDIDWTTRTQPAPAAEDDERPLPTAPIEVCS